jgi:hypothetical protein
LGEKLFDALANLIALAVECVNFFLKGPDHVALLVQLMIEFVGTLLGDGVGLALTLEETDGASNAIFESGKIGAAKSQIALALVLHFGLLVFRDLGFQG